jgi:hypothetical protein
VLLGHTHAVSSKLFLVSHNLGTIPLLINILHVMVLFGLFVIHISFILQIATLY